ncbi:type II secretion system F family protein, partial [Klebsiella pneumoniae]|uniref:type II secretion system F family protein n=1 Tax=Klebsiella pneumoniae TaxID=573 RepID=UPI003A86B906
ERFARRVKLQEAVYVSSSLTVLNKTGGNIVEVFSSIERTLFDKKKLKEEMKNISSAPKIVVIILSIVPVLFIGVVYLLNPTYFNP